MLVTSNPMAKSEAATTWGRSSCAMCGWVYDAAARSARMRILLPTNKRAGELVDRLRARPRAVRAPHRRRPHPLLGHSWRDPRHDAHGGAARPGVDGPAGRG